ncbi:MAG TPA: DegT/DnrJ/EryC1/StrS aminotransferase family protein [bacterium]
MPAIHGGTPIRSDYLHFAKPVLSDPEIDSVVKTLHSGWLTSASVAHDFELAFASYTGSLSACALNSCTAGLFLALKAFDIGPGDEVITTPLTFVASVNVIEHVGAKPVFVDIDPDTWCLSIPGISEKLNNKTKAVIPVHLYGYPCNMTELQEVLDGRSVKIVQDCAHAVESEHHGSNLGSYPDIACYSFYATKNITTGEGGMVVSNDADIIEKIRILALHGLDKSAYNRYEQGGNAVYDVQYPGYKFNMPDILAALGIEGLKLVEERYMRRDAIWNRYRSELSGLPGIILPPDAPPADRHARHIFAVGIDKEKAGIGRDDLIIAMKAENIGTGIHFTPVHRFSYYSEKYGIDPSSLPVADKLGNQLVSLPLTPFLSDQDVDDVISAIQKIIYYGSKVTL